MQWKSSDAAIKANRTIGGSVRGRFACRFNHATPDASKGFLFPKKDNVQDFSFVVAHGESFPDAYIALYETIWNMVKTWLNNADRADTEAPKVSLKQDTCVICGKTVSESAELCDNCLTKALEKLLSPAFIMGAMNPEDIINDLKTEMQNSCRFGVDTKVQPCIYCGANVPVPEKICQRCHMLVGKYMNDRVKKLNDNPTFEMLRKQIEFRHHAEPGRDLQTVFMGPEASGASYCIEWESEQDNEMVYYDAAGTPIKRNRSQSISDSLIKDLTFPTVVPVALTEEVNLRAVFQTDYSFDGHEIISIPSLKRQYIWMNPSEDMKKAKIYPLNIWQASSIQKGNHDILPRMMRDEAPAALTSQELAALTRRLRAALMNSQIYPVKAQRSCLYKGRFTPCRRISLPQRSVPEITDVQAVYIFLRQRYGEQFVFFRRCGNLYRAFYCQTVEERGSIFNLYTPAECERYNLPKTEVVNEECVTDIMEGMCTVGPASCFDRVLSHEEAAYILRIIHGDRNAAPWQSLVGGDMLGGNIIYQDPSRNVTFSEPNQFIMELLDAIRSIAQKGSNLSLPDGYY